MDSIKRMEELVSTLNQLNYNYYVLDKPTVADIEYDRLLDELFKLEKETGVVLPNSPTHKVGSEPISEFKKVKHKNRFYSLEKSQSIEEIEDWIKRNEKIHEHKLELTTEYKFDGLTIALTYENGRYVRATTRGNGIIGEDVTEQVKTFKSVPLEINYKGYVEIQGEGIIRLSVLEQLNKSGDVSLKNARNAAAGAIRNLDPKITASRKLDLMAYNVNYIEGHTFKTQLEENKFLRDNGFRVADFIEIVRSIDDIKKVIAKIDAEKSKLDFLIDGIVFKINNIADREALGYTDRFPRGAIAYKYAPEEISTTLLDVNWQVGRTGKITPIAILSPVDLAGATISRATLNNYNDILKKNISINSRVFIRRSNEVIPEVIGLAERGENAKNIDKPNVCPSCGHPLVEIGANLFCKNHHGCIEQIVDRLTHFASREAMNIDGLSIKTITQLHKAFNISYPYELYKLTKEDLYALEGVKDKKADNLINGIEKSKNVDWASFIFALGILSIGKKTAFVLSKKFKTIEELKNANIADLTAINDIGDVVAKNIIDYFLDADNLENINKMFGLGVKINYPTISNENSYFTNKKIVLTGSLENFSRNDLTKILQDKGADVVSSVSKNTDLVIVGAEPGSKYDKAMALQVKTINEAELLDLLNSEK